MYPKLDIYNLDPKTKEVSKMVPVKEYAEVDDMPTGAKVIKTGFYVFACAVAAAGFVCCIAAAYYYIKIAIAFNVL